MITITATLITLFCAPFLGFWLTLTKPMFYASQWVKTKFKTNKGRPFDCTFCMSFWVACLVYWKFQPDMVLYFTVCLTCAVLGLLTELNYKKPLNGNTRSN